VEPVRFGVLLFRHLPHLSDLLSDEFHYLGDLEDSVLWLLRRAKQDHGGTSYARVDQDREHERSEALTGWTNGLVGRHHVPPPQNTQNRCVAVGRKTYPTVLGSKPLEVVYPNGIENAQEMRIGTAHVNKQVVLVN